MIVAWTGHRPELFRDPEQAQQQIQETARGAVAQWAEVDFVCGGQRGVDLWAAEAGLRLGLAVTMVLPSDVSAFTRDWPASDRGALLGVLGQAHTVEVVDPTNALGARAYDRRNERLVAQADRLIAVWTGLRRGGTFYTLCAARTRGVPTEELVFEAATVVPPTGRGV